MTQRTIDDIIAITTTTNATPVAIVTYALPSGSAAYVDAVISLRNTGNGDGAALRISRCVKNVSGTASTIGSVNNIVTLTADTSLTLASATIAVSGASVVVNVTGVAATNIEWMSNVSVWIN
jgi:hypothetical protein